MLQLFLAAASAADLDLVFTPPEGEPIGVVLGASPGRRPAVTVEGADGASHRLTVDVLRAEADQWLVEFTVEEVRTDRRGRPVVERLDHPWLWLRADHPATVEFAREVPVARDGGVVFEGRAWTVDATVRP